MYGKDLIMATLFGSGGSSGSGGGGSAAVSPKEVNFYDYDGTCVYAYSVAEAQALSELPAGPEHEGLVFQGWNWSLEGVKGLTRTMNIGAMYTTDDGTTRLYITLQEGRTSPKLGVGVNGTVTVDWGDGTEPDVLTGTSVDTTQYTPNHAYNAPGDYVIRLAVVDGEMGLTTHSRESSSALLVRGSEYDARNNAYRSAITKVELSENVKKYGNAVFHKCSNLKTVTVPCNANIFTANVFLGCTSLRYLPLAAGTLIVGNSAFKDCYSLETISLPEGLTGIGSTAMYNCPALCNIELPSTVRSIGTNALYQCRSMKKFVLPGGISVHDGRTIEGAPALRHIVIEEGVTAVKGQTFSSNDALTNVDFPSTFETLGTYVFYQCGALTVCDFTRCVSVPVLEGTDTFNIVPADCEIRVPAALYDEWIAATNWSTYADYIKAY